MEFQQKLVYDAKGLSEEPTRIVSGFTSKKSSELAKYFIKLIPFKFMLTALFTPLINDVTHFQLTEGMM